MLINHRAETDKALPDKNQWLLQTMTPAPKDGIPPMITFPGKSAGGAMLAGKEPITWDRSWEYAGWIIEGREKDTPVRIHGNVMNTRNGVGQLITNLPADGCVEVACMIDRNGVNPTRFGALPAQMAAISGSNMPTSKQDSTRRSPFLQRSEMREPRRPRFTRLSDALLIRIVREMILALTLLAASLFPVSDEALTTSLADRKGAVVLVDCVSGETRRLNPELCDKAFPPCSTFKIWNTAIGLETGVLTSADQPFFKWDGVKRFLDAWNQDLTLRQAYAVSCVPAYQALARKIGETRMEEWIKKLNYGDLNTTSGIDVFWLPAPDRTPILISPDEQAGLLVLLTKGDLPFSKTTLKILRDVMTAKSTEKGTLYGKTGTGAAGKGTPPVGWFVGYIISGKTTLAFACLLTGANAAGKDARTAMEELFAGEGLL